ncbi:hypothetical protein Tco_1433038 [Tanacetum coccineum]
MVRRLWGQRGVTRWRRWIYVGDVVAAAGVAVVMVARCGRDGDDGDEWRVGGGDEGDATVGMVAAGGVVDSHGGCRGVAVVVFVE